MGKHGQLGDAGGSRGLDHEGNIPVGSSVQLPEKEIGLLTIPFLAVPKEIGKGLQPGFVTIGAHACRIDIDHLADVRDLVADLQEFVRLFLILDNHQGGLGAFQGGA